MGIVTRNVNELEPNDRRALEHVIGKPLSEGQQLVIQVLDIKADNERAVEAQQVECDSDKLPDWCNVYEALSDEEIEAIERCIVRFGNGRALL